MKNISKIFSVFLAVFIAIVTMPIASVAEVVDSLSLFSYTNNEKICIKYSNIIEPMLQAKDKIYDGTSKCELDFKSIDLSLNGLNSINNRDEVYLSAQLDFAPYVDASEKLYNATICDFKLKGRDADKYILDDIWKNKKFNRKAKIVPKKIILTPKVTSMECGNNLPDEITHLNDKYTVAVVDEQGIIPNGVECVINNFNEKIFGKYTLSLNNTEENSNVTYILAEGSEFTVKKKPPEISEIDIMNVDPNTNILLLRIKTNYVCSDQESLIFNLKDASGNINTTLNTYKQYENGYYADFEIIPEISKNTFKAYITSSQQNKTLNSQEIEFDLDSDNVNYNKPLCIYMAPRLTLAKVIIDNNNVYFDGIISSIDMYKNNNVSLSYKIKNGNDQYHIIDKVYYKQNSEIHINNLKVCSYDSNIDYLKNIEIKAENKYGCTFKLDVDKSDQKVILYKNGVMPYKIDNVKYKIGKGEYNISVPENDKNVIYSAEDVTFDFHIIKNNEYVSNLNENDQNNNEEKCVIEIFNGKEYDYSKEFSLEENSTENWISVNINKKCKLRPIKIRIRQMQNIDNYEEMIVYDLSYKIKDLIFETDKPKIKVDHSNSSNGIYPSSDGNYWYNPTKNKLLFHIEDDNQHISSGIGSIVLTEDSKKKIQFRNNDFFVEGMFENRKYKVIKIDENKYDIEVDTSTLSEGVHTYEINVEDRCGNDNTLQTEIHIATAESKINVDLSDKGKAIEIDGKKWFTIAAGNPDKITLNATVTSSISDIKSVTVKVNEKDEKLYSTKNSDEYLKKVFDFNLNLKNQIKNKITVTFEFETFSKIKIQPKKVTYYVDTAFPKIQSFTVESASKKGELNVIKRGAFANNSVLIKVYASDGEADSGIKQVEIKSDDGKSLIKLNSNVDAEGKTYFWNIISKNDMLNKKKLIVIATDNLGNKSTSFPKLTSADKKQISDNTYLLIEDKKPKLNIIMPKIKKMYKKGDQLWYGNKGKINIVMSDMDSGIRNVEITVNGKPVSIVSRKTKNKVDSYDHSILQADQTSKSAKLYNTASYSFDIAQLNLIGGSDAQKYVIKTEVTDNAGNVSYFTKTYYSDNKKPEIKMFTFSLESVDGVNKTSDFVEKFEYGYYFKKSTTLKVIAKDPIKSSGMNKIVYTLVSYKNGKPYKKTVKSIKVTKNQKSSIKIPKGFKGQIYAQAYDNLMNASDKKTPLAFIIEHEAPKVEFSSVGSSDNHDAKGNKIFTENVSFKVKVSDFKSGIRNIRYSVNTEKNGEKDFSIDINNTGCKVGTSLGNGWIVTAMERNLVTEISKEISFKRDDNDIQVKVRATDRCGNSKFSQSERFTVDKTRPQIKVSLPKGVGEEDYYYNSPIIAVITVVEKNFDEDLIKAEVEKNFGKNINFVKFKPTGRADEYRANIEFKQGNYNLRVDGTDMGGNNALVKLNGKIENNLSKKIIVDTTPPRIKTNFIEFKKKNSKQNVYFNKAKIVRISVTEHNFDPELMKIKVSSKEPGSNHSNVGFNDCSNEYVYYDNWHTDPKNSDIHIIEFKFSRDGVYSIDVYSSDLSGNTGNEAHSGIFEIDRTTPAIVSSVDKSSSKNDAFTKFVGIYKSKKDLKKKPEIKFEDVNFDHIEYRLTKYVPVYENDKELDKVTPTVEENIVLGKGQKSYNLTSFDTDGVYALESIAYDKAGNKSKVHKSTYFRMLDHKVLAYIENSKKGKDDKIGKGFYSIEDENGPISKRPDSFEDLNIAVISKNNAIPKIILNDDNGETIDTGLVAKNQIELYGAGLYRYTLKGDYFKQNYQEDTDTTLYLDVTDSNKKIELGRIHIDNIAPTCKIPEYFHNWGWIKGSDNITLEFSDISETLDVFASAVYVDGKKIDFDYDSVNNKLSFTLSNGDYNIGISLVDKAGNVYNIPEVVHLGIGNFRLWLCIILSGILVIGISSAIFFVRRRRKRRMYQI